jgi:RES domain-containing protein
MPQAWRIVRAQYFQSAFTGEGAARYGGRWNSRGRPVVYTSWSKSLAALEILVHLNPPLPFKYLAVKIEFEEKLLSRLASAALPSDWRLEPPPPSTKQVGDAWLRTRESAILAVPSVIIPDESNYLLNPGHPEFHQVSFAQPEPFVFDPRLLA